MSKQEILDELRAARAELLDALRGLDDDAMLRPGVVGVWSVKDVLAHVTAWESELVTALNQADARGVPNIVAIEDIDGWNEQQYRVNASRPLDAVVADFESVHAVLLAMVADFDEKALTDGQRYPWMEGEPLAYLIEENAWFHEREHVEDIRLWRESTLSE